MPGDDIAHSSCHGCVGMRYAREYLYAIGGMDSAARDLAGRAKACRGTYYPAGILCILRFWALCVIEIEIEIEILIEV